MSTSFPTIIVVARPFGTYRKGDLITDAATIQAIMTGGNAARVVVPTLPTVAEDHLEEPR